jgi:hypothetical protein
VNRLSEAAQTCLSAAPQPALRAFGLAATHPNGVSQDAWESAVRAVLQQQMELAVLRLSHDAPALLTEDGPRYDSVALRLPLPDGTQIDFRASLQVVE